MSGGPRSLVHTLRDATGRALVVGRADPVTQQLLDAEADAENQRLAYVALTRAQVRLYLPFYGDAMKESAMYHPIQRCVTPWLQARPASARVLFEAVAVPVGAPEPPPPPADALADFVAPEPPPPGELAALPALRGGLTMLSYTRLAHDPEVAAIAAPPGDALAIDPAEFDADDAELEVDPADALDALGETDLPPGAESGLLLHDLLEIAELPALRRAPDAAAWLDDPEVRAQVADKARERGIAERYLPHAAAIAHRALTAPLALIDGTQLPPLIDAAAFAREVEFGYPIPAATTAELPRGLVKGFIDALVAWDDELWVLDYKSDLLTGDDLAALAQHRVRERYAVQARLYAIAADRLRGQRRLAGLLFAFIRHDLVVPVRITDGALATWSDWLVRIGAAGAASVVRPEARP
jgi:exodeoxyribonuclease V beta subunit